MLSNCRIHLKSRCLTMTEFLKKLCCSRRRVTEWRSEVDGDAVGRWCLATLNKRKMYRNMRACASALGMVTMRRSFCFSCFIYEILYMNCWNFVYLCFGFYLLLFIASHKNGRTRTFVFECAQFFFGDANESRGFLCALWFSPHWCWRNVKDVLTNACDTNWCQNEAKLTANSDIIVLSSVTGNHIFVSF